MPAKYPPAMDEAIWTLRTARPKPLPHEEIRKRIREGEAGLDEPIDLPEGTYWDHLRALRRERGHERDFIPEYAELDAIDEITRRAIAKAARDIRRIEETAEQSEKPALEALKIAKELQALKRAMLERRNPQRVRGGEAKRDNKAANPQSTLERLAASA